MIDVENLVSQFDGPSGNGSNGGIGGNAGNGGFDLFPESIDSSDSDEPGGVINASIIDAEVQEEFPQPGRQFRRDRPSIFKANKTAYRDPLNDPLSDETLRRIKFSRFGSCFDEMRLESWILLFGAIYVAGRTPFLPIQMRVGVLALYSPLAIAIAISTLWVKGRLVNGKPNYPMISRILFAWSILQAVAQLAG